MIKKFVSFVIPAYNEVRNIGGLIRSIHNNMDSKYTYEIIVVDNGSDDGTISLATELGAIVTRQDKGTIAKLRNIGVGVSTGKIIVFLDADVELDKDWGDNFVHIVRILETNTLTIAGSQCLVPHIHSWVERYWYKPVEQKAQHGINSGHMIMTRALFTTLGGFDESLETGEDIDITKRAARLSPDNVYIYPELKVYHYGFPETALDFFKRMRWHGKGGLKASKKFFYALMVNFPLIALAIPLYLIWTPFVLAVPIAFFLFMSIWTNKSRCDKITIQGTFLSSVMIAARMVAVFDLLFKRKQKKGTRQR